MSSLHNALPDPQLSLSIRRWFGGDSKLQIERVSETLQPTIDMWSHPECEHLRGGKLWALGTEVGATAGEFSAVGLYVQATTNLIVVVQSIDYLGFGAAQRVELQLATGAAIGATLGTAVTELARDRRSGAPEVVARVGTDPVATLGTTVEFGFSSITEVQSFRNLPIVLTPGFGLIVTNTTVNTALLVNMSGSERVPRPGELL
jgi:hypothetical protein